MLPDKVYCSSIAGSTGKEQAQVAQRAGRKERDIFIEGNGAENFAACIAAIRGPGTLGLVGGVRILGDSRKAIMERMRALKARGISPYDFVTGETDQAELLSSAINRISGAHNLRKDRKTPRKLGRKGGLTKGVRAQEYRDSLLSPDIVRRLIAAPELKWPRKLEILGPGFSESSLRRWLKK